MSATGRIASEASPTASDIAATLRDASFVRIVARADGESLAASGILADALATTGTAFQVSVARPDVIADRAEAVDADELPVVVGAPNVGTEGLTLASGTNRVAFDAAAHLGADPDPVLALAGVVAAGDDPATRSELLDYALDAGRIERRPGVAVPTADLADGLAHTTLAHASFSGDKGAAQAALAELDLPVELDETARREVASLLALDVASGAGTSTRASDAVERALRPYAVTDGTFATVGGYADVLDALAHERPGTGVSLALGHDVRADALDAWRDHAAAAHAALERATTGRYDGLFVARTDDAPVETVARLLRDFRSPEPVALAISDGEAAAASVTECGLGDAVGTAATTVDGTGGGHERRGYARFDADTKEFIAAFREAL